MTKQNNLVSLVLPTYNEEENIQKFYDELTDTIDKIEHIDWEILFVDDGSIDSSVECIEKLIEIDSRVKLVQLSRNFGSHPAITSGLECASGDAAIVMSVDLQDPPSMIVDMIEKWQQGNHIVWGVRQTRQDSWSSKLYSSLFYWLCRCIALPNYPKNGMDCGLFDRTVIDLFLDIPEKNAFIFATIHWLGFKQVEILYDRRPRLGGESGWSLSKRIKSAIDFFISFSYFPIRTISHLGILISFASFIYASFLIIRKVFWGLGGIIGWPSLMVTLLFLGGIQLIMLGVLGEYIWRNSDQSKGRPLYIIMNKKGF